MQRERCAGEGRSSRNRGNMLHRFGEFRSALNLAFKSNWEKNLVCQRGGALSISGRFKTMKAIGLAFVLAAGMAIAAPAGAQAKDRSDNDIFCAAIGLSEANQIACSKQLAGATSVDDRRSVQVTWVARSATIVGASHLDTPPLGNNPLDGKPATIYYSKVGYVPNRVVADIDRAMNTVLRNPASATPFAAGDSQIRNR